MRNFKIVLIVIILVALTNSNLYSQRVQNPSGTSDLCVKQYDIIVDGFYGFPYIGGAFYKKIIADSLGTTYIHSKNLNHFGGRIEYMAWNKIGFGLEYTYGLLSIKYEGSGGKWYKAGIAKQRVLAKFNFHFATSENMDPYLTAGLGYSNTKMFSDEPKTKTYNITLFPVAFRVGIGFRYFFTDMVGINAEVGIGGPLMQGGLSFKF